MAKKMPSKGRRAVAGEAGLRSGNGFSGKRSSGTPIAAAKGEPGAKLNPFERLWNRRKFDVLGKKTKGEQKKIGQSRSRAVEMRKDTLLHEYRQSKKANAFIDRRFGEADDSLAEDDKAIMRYQKERLAQLNKTSRFNLKDEEGSEGEEELLTHRGMAAGMDDFDEGDLPGGEEDDDAELDAEIVDKLHFGGFESKKGGSSSEGAVDGKPKSRKEVMDELIAKSKFYKAQKAKEKEETDELLGTLDEQFKELTQQRLLNSKPSKKDDLAGLMAKYGMTSEGKGGEVAVGKGPGDLANGKKGQEAGRDKKGGEVKKEERDDYEKLAREMASEIRARASDRTKDPEEVAKEERERLEKLEKKRKQRMEGLEDASDEDESDDEKGGRRAQKRRKRAEVSGDDLGENFVLEGEEYQQEGWATDIMKQGEEEEDEEGGGEGDDESDESGDDDDVSGDNEAASGDEDGIIAGESSDEESGSEQEEDLDGFLDAVRKEKEKRAAASKEEGIPARKTAGKEGEVVVSRKEGVSAKKAAGKEGEVVVGNNGKQHRKGGKEKKGEKGAKKELPFVIDVPQTLELFRALVDGRSDAELALAVERIRACNSVNLAAENRRKMQIFYSVLVQYFSALAGETPLPLSRIDVLVKPLLQMSQDTPLIAAVNARERILKMQQQLTAKLRDQDGSTCWPSNRTLLLLRLWTLTFPLSDFRHPVMTPLSVLVGEYLARCPVWSFRDAAVGAFLSSMALQLHTQAKRFCPEALSFLHALLLTALPPKSPAKRHSLWAAVPAYLKDQVGSQQWLFTRQNKPSENGTSSRTAKDKGDGNGAPRDHTEAPQTGSEPAALDFVSLLSADPGEDLATVENKHSLLAAALETLGGFVRLYKGLPSFPELFGPLGRTLEGLREEIVRPEALQALVSRLIDDIKSTSADHVSTRQAVRMRTKRAEPIKQYNPRFEEDGFVQGRDYDPDRERAEKKKLRKQLKKETKGAARELRKDNYFLAEEKRRDKLVEDDERQEKYRSAMAFLQEQEGAFKSGQLGGGKRKKK